MIYLLWLWNVYNNATYIYEKGDVFAIGIVAVMYKIKEELEEKILVICLLNRILQNIMFIII